MNKKQLPDVSSMYAKRILRNFKYSYFGLYPNGKYGFELMEEKRLKKLKDYLIAFWFFQGIILEVIIIALIVMHYYLSRNIVCGYPL